MDQTLVTDNGISQGNKKAPALEKETRFAVVMYGGVSLAIYIYGVAKELYSMVRATARESGNESEYLLNELTETEKIYRQIGERLKTKFVVDILSGTSAGGINAVYLAKALVNNQSFDMLKNVWLDQGDIGLLVNDSGSNVKEGIFAKDPPASLLNSQRMYYYLLDALTTMEEENGKNTDNAPSPFVNELDLHVTATDIRGLPVDLQISNAKSAEFRYRNVLNFHYLNTNTNHEIINEFTKEHNPLLAFAARCTSAFPFAFEPMRLDEIEQVLNLSRFKKDYDYPRSVNDKWGKFFKEYVKKGSDFQKQAFGDGGYIDNKPFSYATETLLRRRADHLVDRKLVYIDPSPEHPEFPKGRKTGKDDKPDAIENVMAALISIPRYEPIREDLEKVMERNRVIRHFHRIFDNIEQLSAPKKVGGNAGRKTLPKWQTSGRMWAAKLIDEREVLQAYGNGYAAYHQLRVASVIDNLHNVFCAGLGYEVHEKNAQYLRTIMEGWCRKYYVAQSAGYHFREDGIEFPLSQNDILFRLDITWRIRRIFFLQNVVNRLLMLLERGDEQKLSSDEAIGLVNGFLKEGEEEIPVSRLKKVNLTSELASIKDSLLEYKRKLNEAYEHLKIRERALRRATTAEADQEKDPGLKNYLTALLELKTLLEKSKDENHLENMAKEASGYFATYSLPGSTGGVLLNDLETVFRQIEKVTSVMAGHFTSAAVKKDTPKGYIHETLSRASAALYSALSKEMHPSIEKYIAYYRDRFEYYDMQFFPMQYGTEVGESDEVEIIRISPEDGVDLVDETKTGRKKLAGTTFFNFGAFFSREWRQNDMMWGRLDAAECLVKAVAQKEEHLPKEDTPWISQEIQELHRAILADELKPRDQTKIARAKSETKRMGEKPETGELKEADNLIPIYEEYRKKLEKNGKARWLYQAIHRLSKQEELLERFRTDCNERGGFIDREFPPRSTLDAGSRSMRVIGKLLGGLSQTNKALSSPAKWLATIGGILAGILATALPSTVGGSLGRYWVWLFYLFEIFMIVVGLLFSSSGLAGLGFALLIATALSHIVFEIIGNWLAEKITTGAMRKCLARLLGVILVVLIIIGGMFGYVGAIGLGVIDFPAGLAGDLLGLLIRECPKTLPTDGMLFCRPAE